MTIARMAVNFSVIGQPSAFLFVRFKAYEFDGKAHSRQRE
jgi:hypothetical protein